MKTYSIFQEYIWLVSTLQRYGKLSLEELNGHWVKTEMSGGVPIPRTTFNRHRDAILDMLGIIIDCDKKDKYRYYIANEGLSILENAERMGVPTPAALKKRLETMRDAERKPDGEI